MTEQAYDADKQLIAHDGEGEGLGQCRRSVLSPTEAFESVTEMLMHL